METRSVSLTLDKAKEWYERGGKLKEIALQAFSEKELKDFDFRNIKSFEDALKALGMNYITVREMIKVLASLNNASASAYKLSIIRKALHISKNIHFTTGNIYYPFIFIYPSTNPHSYYSHLEACLLGTVKIDGILYQLFLHDSISNIENGIGNFTKQLNRGNIDSISGFIRCATKEIANHLGKYFYKEIFEAMYADFVNFKWIK